MVIYFPRVAPEGLPECREFHWSCRGYRQNKKGKQTWGNPETCQLESSLEISGISKKVHSSKICSVLIIQVISLSLGSKLFPSIHTFYSYTF